MSIHQVSFFKKHILHALAIALLLSVQNSYSADYLKFKEACASTEDIQIIGVGDILLHAPLQRQGLQSAEGFKSLWPSLIPVIQAADLAYSNLEGPAADGVTKSGKVTAYVSRNFDNNVYTSYPMFNYHSTLVSDIKESGFDIVSTANNHSLDRRSVGVNRTIKALEEAQLSFTGTKSTENDRQEWYTITKTKGRSIAWLACTFSTNGIPDQHSQVLPCFQNTESLLNLVKKLSNDPKIDAVIVTPHWGNEYELKQNRSQIQLGHKLIDAGAIAVIGTHPHVVQPWEKYVTAGGREGLIVYSTGNFVSGQPNEERKTSLMVSLRLTGLSGEKLSIRGAEFVPLRMNRGKYQVIDVRRAFVNNPESLPPKAMSIWNTGYNVKNIMQPNRDKSLEHICNMSK